MRIEHFDELPSTQEYAKGRRDGKEDLIVTADRQSFGRGTKGRSFSSNEGGMYLSKLTFHEDFPVREAFKIMVGAAVAVCETLRAFGFSPKIKWPNDIHVNGKKICGILIENVFSGRWISSSVVGIGVNVNNALPDELADIATSMQLQGGKRFSVEEVRKKLIEKLGAPINMVKYREYLGYMGEEATLFLEDERIPATLLSVDDEGGLWVKTADTTRRLTAAEVRISLKK